MAILIYIYFRLIIRSRADRIKFNSCRTEVVVGNTKPTYISIICHHSEGVGSSCLPCIVNVMVADALATQEARASPGILLTFFYWPVCYKNGLNLKNVYIDVFAYIVICGALPLWIIRQNWASVNRLETTRWYIWESFLYFCYVYLYPHCSIQFAIGI